MTPRRVAHPTHASALLWERLNQLHYTFPQTFLFRTNYKSPMFESILNPSIPLSCSILTPTNFVQTILRTWLCLPSRHSGQPLLCSVRSIPAIIMGAPNPTLFSTQATITPSIRAPFPSPLKIPKIALNLKDISTQLTTSFFSIIQNLPGHSIGLAVLHCHQCTI